jgi:hypothetical protein
MSFHFSLLSLWFVGAACLAQSSPWTIRSAARVAEAGQVGSHDPILRPPPFRGVVFPGGSPVFDGMQIELDVDGDGVLEIVRPVNGASSGTVYGLAYNSMLGSGDWVSSTILQSTVTPPAWTVLEYSLPMIGDFDGDGKGDVLTSRFVRSSPIQGNLGPEVPSIWLRNAQGHLEERFQLTTMRVAISSGVTMDFDADGDMDLFLCTSAGARTYINQGSGVFTDVTATSVVQPLGYQGGPSVLVDADLDGDMDVFATTSYQFRSGPTYLFENLGAGQFVARDQFVYVYSPSVSAIDVNGDGHRDVVISYPVTATTWPVHAFLAAAGSTSMPNGTSLLPTVLGQARKTAAFDFDQDGDEDLLVAGDRHALWENVNGRLLPGPSISTPGAGLATARTMIDFDRDGDLDVITGVFGGGIVAMSNQYREARLIRTPTRGGSFDVGFIAQAGHALVSMISPAAARFDIPGLGLVLLDPQLGILGPTIRYPFAYEATVSFPVPSSASMSGVQLHVQGLDLDLARGTAQMTARVKATVP